MEDSAMFTAEFIVGLWFLPVILFIIVPLIMLSAWSLYQLVGMINEKAEALRRSAKQASGKGYAPLQIRPAV